MIDTHCHLTYDGLAERIDDVIAAANAHGVDRMISVGTTPEDARRAIELSDRLPCVFATAGIHPHYALHVNDADAAVAEVERLCRLANVVAIGEMGLDKHYPDPPLDDQRRIFAAQLAVARNNDLPIIIHNREATDDTLAMIRDSGVPGERFVFHCFTGEGRELDAILAIGAMVSFTGITTFGSAKSIAASATRMPIDRIMIETDSPYLTPEPHRKVRPNEPQYVRCVAEFIARERGMRTAAFVDAVDANAERFFKLPKRN